MAKRMANKLTAREVSSLSKDGWHGDGAGLWLRITSDGRKSWVFVYKRNGKRREMGLGTATGAWAVSLQAAREAAMAARSKLRSGVDPLDDQRARTAAKASEEAAQSHEASVPTFGDFADEYVRTMSPKWRNPKHAAQWTMTLKDYCAPIRAKRVDAIQTADILELLKTHWTERPETASRLRGRIENVLDAATAKGFREGLNPARWKGHLNALLPARQRLTRGHHAALPFKELPSFMSELQGRDGIAPKMLEFLILTAVRTGEAIQAQWSQIDLKEAIWDIPASAKKEGRAHRVPLSSRAVEILKEFERVKIGPYVFSANGKSPLSNMAMATVLKRMDRDDITVHGFRSSFRDWASEVSTFPHEVCEMALAHTIGNKAEAAYRRGDLFEKRKKLMAAWANYCKPRVSKVVQFGAGSC